MTSFRVHHRILLVVSTALLVKHGYSSSGRRRNVFHATTRVDSGKQIQRYPVQRRTFVSKPIDKVSDFSSSSSQIYTCESLSLSICSALRGGAIERRDASGVELYMRNIVQSLLKSSKDSTMIHSALQTFFQVLESVTGYRLLPEVETKSKKRKKKKPTKKELDTIEVESEQSIEKVAEDGKKRSASKKSKKSSAATKLQLKRELKPTNPMYRIQQELKAFIKDPPEHLSVATGKNIRVWIVTVEGIGIYKGETYRLRIQFPTDYPTVPPSVYFLPPNIPLHEHVYTNGDICLSLLGKDWRPTMTAQSVAHSILSILGSSSSKSLPMDNARHAQNKPGQYQADWVYHDDNC